MKKNLYYFVCPANPPVWRWNVGRLLTHWGTFNGRRLVAVATGEGLEPEGVVRAAFDGAPAEFIAFPNDRDLRETAFFVEGLTCLQSLDPQECTFYGHTKGQAYEGRRLENVKRWTDAMYILNLGSPDLVDRLVGRHPIIGCFKRRIDHGGAPWHYAGTFFWFRHDALFSRNWRDICRTRYGTEGYPGRMFRDEEAFELTPRWFRNLYKRAPLEATYRAWLRNLVEGRAPGSRWTERRSAFSAIRSQVKFP